MAPDHYPLTRGPLQINRVNILQYVWRDTLGYLLHPSIPLSITQVADIATATGLWLCELRIKSAEINVLDGFDISDASFIPPHDLPSKVVLQVANATETVPPKLQHRYDLVHVRLLQPAVNDNDPSQIVQHCKDLLRPGGYLQWEEFDPLGLETHHAEGVARPSCLDQLQDKLLTRAPVSWISELPKFLEENGMSVVAVDRKREPSWHRRTMTNLFCATFEEFATFLSKRGPPGSEEQIRAITSGVYDEAMKGSYSSHLFQTVVARKI